MIDRNLTAQQEKLKSLNEKMSRIVDSVQTKVEWECKEEPVLPILTCWAFLQGLSNEIPKLCFLIKENKRIQFQQKFSRIFREKKKIVIGLLVLGYNLTYFIDFNSIIIPVQAKKVGR